MAIFITDRCLVIMYSHEFDASFCRLAPAKSLWRNRLARSAVNRKVGGSSPPRDESVSIFLFFRFLDGLPDFDPKNAFLPPETVVAGLREGDEHQVSLAEGDFEGPPRQTGDW